MTGSARLLAVALVFATPLGTRAQEGGTPPSPDAASLASTAQAVVGLPRARALSGLELETATHEVATLLRCPVCQGLSVADSPTELARNMKHQARQLLAGGYDREQVLAYFESSYGEFVRLKPPLRGINWVVWVAPLLGLLGGGFVVARSMRRLKGRAAPAPEAAAEEDDPELAPYLRRVRELAYGWPDGRPPGPAASAPEAAPAPPRERS